MAVQHSTAVRNAQITAIESTIGPSPILRLRTGAPPANPAASRTGTILASITLPSDWLSNPSGGVGSLAGTWSGTGAAAAGAGTAAGHFEILESTGTTCHQQGTVTHGGNTAWAGSTAYVVGQRRVNNGNLYQCSTAGTSASSGGPTGTGSGITDGTAAWNYVSAVGDMTIDGASIAEGQAFSVSTYNLTAGNS